MCIHKLLKYIFIIITILICSSAKAFDSIDSQHSDLKNKVIAAIGVAKEVAPPSGTEWEEQVYSLNSYCFTLSGYYGYWGYSGKSAMLVVDDYKLVQLAIFETSISNISVKLHNASILQCPEHTNIIPSCNGLSPDECKTLLKEYMRKLNKQIKDLSK